MEDGVVYVMGVGIVVQQQPADGGSALCTEATDYMVTFFAGVTVIIA
jgi:hypothetical protein